MEASSMFLTEDTLPRLLETRRDGTESTLRIGEILPAVLERYGLTARTTRRTLPNDRSPRTGNLQCPMLSTFPIGSLKAGTWQTT